MFVDACHALDLPLVPDLYVGAGGEINAFTAGVDKPIVVLNSGAIDLLSDDELRFVMAHELGHVKSGHVLYYQIAEFLPVITEAIGDATFGVGALLGAGVQVALLNWRRKSEHTADRAGLLVVQDLQVALSALMKLAGLPQRYSKDINVDDFVAQARAFEGMDSDKLSWFAKWLSTAGQTHPWTVLRAKECLEWVDDGGYERVLAKPAEVPLRAAGGHRALLHALRRGLRRERGVLRRLRRGAAGTELTTRDAGPRPHRRPADRARVVAVAVRSPRRARAEGLEAEWLAPVASENALRARLAAGDVRLIVLIGHGQSRGADHATIGLASSAGPEPRAVNVRHLAGLLAAAPRLEGVVLVPRDADGSPRAFSGFAERLVANGAPATMRWADAADLARSRAWFATWRDGRRVARAGAAGRHIARARRAASRRR